MAIAAQPGGACGDSFNALEQSVLAGKSTGAILLNRLDETVSVSTASSETISDGISAAMYAPTTSPYFFNPAISLPPQGACETFAADYNILATLNFPGAAAGGQLLDAGASLTLTGSSLTAPVSTAPVLYQQLLGGNNTTNFSNPLFFNPPAPVTVTAPGGAVGAFSVSIPTAGALQWTAESALQSVTRSQPLTVNWTATGTTNATVLVAGGNFDVSNNAAGVFVCTASAAAGTLTVPAWAMANVPATGKYATLVTGLVMLGLEPLGSMTPFTASGLGAGFGLYVPWISKNVTWQ
jgi:hypothetical protein